MITMPLADLPILAGLFVLMCLALVALVGIVVNVARMSFEIARDAIDGIVNLMDGSNRINR